MPAELLQRVVAGFTPELRRARVAVAVSVDPELATLHADAIGLEQVLVNLIDNAIDASPRGATIAVSASLRPEQEGREGRDEHCELVVEDEGPGVDPESAQRIFEPFFTTKASRGTGLGLAVSHRIVVAHGGTIHAERRADGRPGARFVVRLPLRAQLVAPAEVAPAAPAAARAASGAPRLLLVDDDDAVRALVLRRLAQHGFEVVEARDGAEAIEKARASLRPFDVAISDVRMRGISGLALYEELVRAAPRLAQRFVAITGDLLAPEVGRIAAASRCEVFEKPLDLERLVGCVAALARGEFSGSIATPSA